MKFDLHTHSTASDGTLTPPELVVRAKSMGVTVLALTDHDTLAGLGEAATVSREIGVLLVPGVEISVTWEQITVHILGFWVDVNQPELVQGLKQLQDVRATRALEIGKKLADAGITETYSEAAMLARGQLISRTHFAQVLIRRGHAKDMQAVFKRYLVKNKPGYVPGDWATLEQAVSWISAAGGLAVIAHPARYKLSAGKLRTLFEEFRAVGGSGLEVVSGSHSDLDCIRMGEYAQRYEFYASAGSDYHGDHHQGRELGRLRSLPENITPIWDHAQWRVRQARSAAARDSVL